MPDWVCLSRYGRIARIMAEIKRVSRKMGFYERYVKRALDIACALAAVIMFFWLYIAVAVLVKKKLGSPVIYKQPRPGLIDSKTGKERIFTLYKFRSMTDEKDERGDLLPDKQRLTHFGRWLRDTSMDELPEAFNILRGDMSIIGPRPQLVRDMVFMTPEQRMRHTARPGLSGLAQVMGRNAITWEEKFKWDLKYIRSVSLWNDVMIILKTVRKVFIRPKTSQSSEETDLALDYGDVLLKKGEISDQRYSELQAEARRILASL